MRACAAETSTKRKEGSEEKGNPLPRLKAGLRHPHHTRDPHGEFVVKFRRSFFLSVPSFVPEGAWCHPPPCSCSFLVFVYPSLTSAAVFVLCFVFLRGFAVISFCMSAEAVSRRTILWGYMYVYARVRACDCFYTRLYYGHFFSFLFRRWLSWYGISFAFLCTSTFISSFLRLVTYALKSYNIHTASECMLIGKLFMYLLCA